MYIIVIYILIIWIIFYHYTKSTIDQEHKTFLLAKSEGIQTTLKDVHASIPSRTEEQQLKESKHNKQSNGHIVSYNPFSRLQ